MWAQHIHRNWVSQRFQIKRIVQGINQQCKMSEAGIKPQHEWLVILPDHDGALDKRLEVRGYDT